ncbi:nuclear transport factor 2-like protein [Echinicola shivajiensis]|uniref:nuclear transport factor 2 family protein n=1 Tax=Echinicola shivajiensis TaxID=1035916 RepID=UPI001BFCB92C|nr:nuclear transport factor 2 family protein [Echinicola shivajiensis]
MAKIISSPNCGNSPKMEFLKSFNIAFAEGNMDFIIEGISDEIIWNIIGDKKITGKENFEGELPNMKTNKVAELALHQILSHGKEGAVNGTMKMQNGKQYAFSDFYQFSSAKGNMIKSITSYIIEIK